MTETVSESEPTCPYCGARWRESGPRFAIAGDLSHLPFEEATIEYEQAPEQYDDTSVDRFACGTVLARAAQTRD